MSGFPLSQDLAVVRTLLGGTWGPSEGLGMPSWESRTVIEGLGCAYRGPVSLCGGPNPMMHPGVYHLSLPRGAPRPAHVVGSGAVLRAARRSRTCTTSLYCSRGTPGSRYRQWPPGPPQGRIRACRWGQSLIGDWPAAPARLLMQLLSARLWSRRLPRLFPRLTGP
jgi:hypothetical protein